jgi:hypothetical protein
MQDHTAPNTKIFGLFVQAGQDVQRSYGSLYVIAGEFLYKDGRSERYFAASVRPVPNDTCSHLIEVLELRLTFRVEYVDPKGGRCFWLLYKDDTELGELLSDKLPEWLALKK